MNDHLEATAPDGALPQPPFLYEIRVKGRLSDEQWTSWFDDLTLSFKGGESTLRGAAADHAALYGVLARLRDLAVPLVAVKVLDADAQRRLAGQSRRTDLAVSLLLAALYLIMLGGLTAITVLVTHVLNTALALALLFALLGGMAHAFWLWSGQRAWRWLSYFSWAGAAVCFAVFIPISGLFPVELGLGILLFIIAGGLVYLVSHLRRYGDEIKANLPAGVARWVEQADDAGRSRLQGRVARWLKRLVG